jgi:Asp-tRNA(Asn)/Glu-tRNA(Gln) amidotransferase A subunit family amidase
MRKILLLALVLITGAIILYLAYNENKAPKEITTENISSAEKLAGLQFDEKERDSMLQDVQSSKSSYEKIREHDIPNGLRPSLVFNPLPVGFFPEQQEQQTKWNLSGEVKLPETNTEIAFLPVHQLSVLIREGKLSSERLTKIYLKRLEQYSDTLQCLVTLTEELALEQARRADKEIAEGKYRGPLHGIPYGVKDLLAVEGFKTSWGATPYKDQVVEETATVVSKLEEAGAVLVAKLTLGALAMGDVWYGGVTKNPYDLKQGSSGSSAGSASATSAGLVAFALGTETYGSIVSPSTRCGVSGLRPTFGRVSRFGAMALSWSMDKIGPISRSAKDNAIILDVISGKDKLDPSTISAGFSPDFEKDIKGLKVAYVKDFFNQDYRGKRNDSLFLEEIREMGITPEAVKFPDDIPVDALLIILDAEAAAAFDELTRSNRDDNLVWQRPWSWPNLFRQARFIPAVEYINANRIRRQLIDEMHMLMSDVDLYVSPTYGGSNLLITNLTGHPCVVLPNGFREDGTPTSITFIGKLFDEGTIISVGKAYQKATKFDEQHPARFM